ncbi:MAG: family 2 glycosyl transferase [Bacteroidia bacterium]|nr:family 2 glycosyl transferase [Bacteroidia bacterium]
MKIGIIIIFNNNEKDIDTDFFIKQIEQSFNLELCFVNNDSNDNTQLLLNEIKENCSNVSVVNIKKNTSDVSAVRAGARFMFSQFNLKHIGYVNTNVLENKTNKLNSLIKTITKNQDSIIKHNIEVLKKQDVKPTLYQSLFSVVEYLKSLNKKIEFVKLQY